MSLEEIIGAIFWIYSNYGSEDINPFPDPETFRKSLVSKLAWGLDPKAIETRKVRIARNIQFGLAYHRIDLDWSDILKELNQGNQKVSTLCKDLAKKAKDNR